MGFALAVRAGLGAAAYLAPRRTARVVGLDPDRNDQMLYTARVFGARDVGLSAAVLATDDHQHRRRLLLVSAAIDTTDMVSALAAYRRGSIDPRATGALIGVAVAALVPETMALLADRTATS